MSRLSTEFARRLFDGILVENVKTFGQRVDISVRIDDGEASRRQETDATAILNPAVLRFLASLPAGIRLPVELLDPLERLALDEAVELRAAYQEAADTFVVAARPPVELLGLVMTASCWDDIVAVSFLRTHAARAVVVNNSLARRVLRDADVGLGVVSGKEVVRFPTGREVRSSWQRWLTAELAYAQLLAS